MHGKDEVRFFFFLRYGIEGPVYLTPRSEKGSGEWYVDEQQQKIKKMDGSVSSNVLQKVQIHMEICGAIAQPAETPAHPYLDESMTFYVVSQYQCL